MKVRITCTKANKLKSRIMNCREEPKKHRTKMEKAQRMN